MPTTQKIAQFSNGREPRDGDRIVYVDGAFDLFHVGHIELLKKARGLGDFVLVGVHDDYTVNRIKGLNHPIMNMHERLLGVLSCKYVDEVIIGAPYSVTKDLLENCNYKISLVLHGKTETVLDLDKSDPYRVPKELGIFQQVESCFPNLSAQTIIDRIIKQRQAYEERNRKKQQKELASLSTNC